MPSKVTPEQEVKSWGYSSVFTWTDSPNAYYAPHRHRGPTTHLITKGTLTIRFPEDKQHEKETFVVGGRVDVAANQLHEVWVGEEGCTYVIGE